MFTLRISGHVLRVSDTANRRHINTLFREFYSYLRPVERAIKRLQNKSVAEVGEAYADTLAREIQG